MKIKLIDKNKIIKTNQEDPLHYYYQPILGYLYRYRIKMVMKLLANNHFNRLIDIGYGSGILFPVLSDYADNLYGVDMHNNNETTQKLLYAEGIKVELKSGHAGNLPYKDNFFDAVVGLSVLEFVEDLDKAVSEINRISAPDAKIVIGAPVFNIFTDISYWLMGFKEEDLHHKCNQIKIQKAMAKKFKVIKTLKLPFFLPLNMGLFFCSIYEKILQ